jgi:hypothetical protein
MTAKFKVNKSNKNKGARLEGESAATKSMAMVKAKVTAKARIYRRERRVKARRGHEGKRAAKANPSPQQRHPGRKHRAHRPRKTRLGSLPTVRAHSFRSVQADEMTALRRLRKRRLPTGRRVGHYRVDGNSNGRSRSLVAKNAPSG